MTTAAEVVARRKAERQALLDIARAHVVGLQGVLNIVAAVVVGSVARGDFHAASDVDVVIVAPDLPDDDRERWRLVASRRGILQPIAWTPSEWHAALRQRNPLAVDALAHGVWLLGSADTLRPSEC